MTDTSRATVEVQAITRALGHGRLFGLAAVEVVVDGVPLLIQGIALLRAGGGLLEAALPTHRTLAGTPSPSIVLPPELEEAVLRAALGAATGRPVVKVRVD